MVTFGQALTQCIQFFSTFLFTTLVFPFTGGTVFDFGRLVFFCAILSLLLHFLVERRD